MPATSVAVVIPAFNVEAYVCEALDSISVQSRRPEEIIVVDDGSSDNTAEVVRAWSKDRKTEVLLLRQAHRGPAAARNNALRHTKADLVALLDADDLFLPHHLAQANTAFGSHSDIVLYFADAEVFSQAGVKQSGFLAGKPIAALEFDHCHSGVRLIRGSAYLSLLRGNWIPVSSTVISRRAMERVGLYDEALLHATDRYINLRLSRIGRFAYCPAVSARKRIHRNSMSNPCDALRPHRDRLRVLQEMEKNATVLGLSSVEILRTREAIGYQASQLLAVASRRGMKTYLRACIYIIQHRVPTSVMNPKHLLRALVFSAVKRNEGETRGRC